MPSLFRYCPCFIQSMLLWKYASIFFAFKGDIECINLISYDFFYDLCLMTSLWDRDLGISPSYYDTLKAHMCQLLDSQFSQVIQEHVVSLFLRFPGEENRWQPTAVRWLPPAQLHVFPLPWIKESFDALTAAHGSAPWTWIMDTIKSLLWTAPA